MAANEMGDSLLGLAGLEVRFGSQFPDIQESAPEFERLVRESKAFRWGMVVSSSVDGREPRIDVYLGEKNPLPEGEIDRSKLHQAFDAFDTLSMALKPRVSFHLFRLPDSEWSLEKVRQRFEDVKSRQPEVDLLGEIVFTD
jgi:hypothetical protein